MGEADLERRRLPEPGEKQELMRFGIEIRENSISGASDGELPTIIIAALVGGSAAVAGAIAGGFLAKIGDDLWELLKAYFKKRYWQLERDRRKRATIQAGRFRVERFYIVTEIFGVPVVYYLTPNKNELDLDFDAKTLASAERDIAVLAEAGKLDKSDFLAIDLDHLEDGPYFRQYTVPPNIISALQDRNNHKSRAYTHALVAISFSEMALWEDAIRHYRISLDSHPEDAGLRKNLGSVLARKGDFDSALGEFAKALSIDGDLKSFHYNLACAHAVAGDTRAAASELTRAVKAGYCDLDEFLSDPDFASVRESPEILAIAATIKQLRKQ
jgi:tetratricopeptide (TPR) repeat protein